MGIAHSLFEEKLEALKKAKGAKQDTDLSAADLRELVAQYKNVYVEAKGERFPTGRTKLPPPIFFLYFGLPRGSRFRTPWCVPS